MDCKKLTPLKTTCCASWNQVRLIFFFAGRLWLFVFLVPLVGSHWWVRRRRVQGQGTRSRKGKNKRRKRNWINWKICRWFLSLHGPTPNFSPTFVHLFPTPRVDDCPHGPKFFRSFGTHCVFSLSMDSMVEGVLGVAVGGNYCCDC